MMMDAGDVEPLALGEPFQQGCFGQPLEPRLTERLISRIIYARVATRRFRIPESTSKAVDMVAPALCPPAKTRFVPRVKVSLAEAP